MHVIIHALGGADIGLDIRQQTGRRLYLQTAALPPYEFLDRLIEPTPGHRRAPLETALTAPKVAVGAEAADEPVLLVLLATDQDRPARESGRDTLGLAEGIRKLLMDEPELFGRRVAEVRICSVRVLNVNAGQTATTAAVREIRSSSFAAEIHRWSVTLGSGATQLTFGAVAGCLAAKVLPDLLLTTKDAVRPDQTVPMSVALPALTGPLPWLVRHRLWDAIKTGGFDSKSTQLAAVLAARNQLDHRAASDALDSLPVSRQLKGLLLEKWNMLTSATLDRLAAADWDALLLARAWIKGTYRHMHGQRDLEKNAAGEKIWLGVALASLKQDVQSASDEGRPVSDADRWASTMGDVVRSSNMGIHDRRAPSVNRSDTLLAAISERSTPWVDPYRLLAQQLPWPEPVPGGRPALAVFWSAGPQSAEPVPDAIIRAKLLTQLRATFPGAGQWLLHLRPIGSVDSQTDLAATAENAAASCAYAMSLNPRRVATARAMEVSLRDGLAGIRDRLLPELARDEALVGCTAMVLLVGTGTKSMNGGAMLALLEHSARSGIPLQLGGVAQTPTGSRVDEMTTGIAAFLGQDDMLVQLAGAAVDTGHLLLAQRLLAQGSARIARIDIPSDLVAIWEDAGGSTQERAFAMLTARLRFSRHCSKFDALAALVQAGAFIDAAYPHQDAPDAMQRLKHLRSKHPAMHGHVSVPTAEVVSAIDEAIREAVGMGSDDDDQVVSAIRSVHKRMKSALS